MCNTYVYFLIIYTINLTPCINLKEEDTSSSKSQLKNYTDEGISSSFVLGSISSEY